MGHAPFEVADGFKAFLLDPSAPRLIAWHFVHGHELTSLIIHECWLLPILIVNGRLWIGETFGPVYLMIMRV